MALPMLIEAELDDRSASAAATRMERTFSAASRDISRTVTSELGTAFRDVGQDAERMADSARSAFRRMGDASEEVTRQERGLQQAREQGSNDIDRQSRRVEDARGREVRAIREATGALGDYEQAARQAGSAGDEASTRVVGGFSGIGSALRGAGGEAAGGFAEGFAGASALGRLGAAGGPIGLALAGIAALGFAGGKALVDQIEQGMASLHVQDVFQARLGLDDASAAQAGQAAAGAYTNAWGESIEANLGAIQFGMQGGLINRDATAADIQATTEQMQALAEVMNTDVQTIARSAGQLIRGGLAESAEQAMDILAVGSQRGLDIAGDWMDTVGEYTTQFRKLGLEGSDAIGLIQQGLEGAARDSDVVADSLKEFSIRAVDGTKGTAEGFMALGFNADDMGRRFAVGGETARAAFGAVLQAIRETDDPMQQKLIWAQLFGTQFEDMGDAINRFDLAKVRDEVGTTDGAIQEMTNKVGAQTSGWDTLGRQIDTTFDKLRTWLADSSIGDFFAHGLPDALGTVIAPSTPGIAGFGVPNSTRPINPLDILIPGAPGAPAGGPGSLLLPNLQGPPPPAAPPGAPAPTAGARTPIVPDADKPSGGAAAAKPSFDPSQYSLDAIPVQGAVPVSPMAPGSPGAQLVVDPGKVFDAQTAEQSARASVESARVRVLELEADNTSTAQSVQAAKNQVQNSERAYLSAQAKLIEAQQGTWTKANDAISGAMTDLNSVFAPLADDFGISGGLPGIAANLVKIFGNMALGNAIGSSNPAWRDSILADMAASRAPASAAGTPGATTPTYSARAVQAGAAGAPGAAMSGESGRAFAHRVEMPFFESQGYKVGDHAADSHGEHQNGAIDIMVDSIAEGNKVLQQVLSDTNTYGAIFNQTQYGYGKGTTGIPMEDRGDPTQNHMDHVHAFFKPGGANNINPGGAGHAPGSPLTQASANTSSPVPVNVVNGPSALMNGSGLSDAQWNKIAGAEASGNWAANTGNGFSGGLQFSPSTWDQFGGQQYAPQAWQATPQQQMAVGDATLAGQGPGAWPATSAAHPEWFQPGGGGAGLPAIPAGAGGQGYMGLGGPPQSGPPGTPGMGTGVTAPGASGGGIQGLGVSFPGAPGGGAGGGGDLIGAAASMFPGGGQLAKAASRTIEFGAQAAAIGVSGLMQTFPAGSERAANGWFPKIIGGLSGAKPASPNKAGGQAPMQQPGGAPGGIGQQAGQGGDTNINVTNNRATEDGTGRDIAFHQNASNRGPGN